MAWCVLRAYRKVTVPFFKAVSESLSNVIKGIEIGIY